MTSNRSGRNCSALRASSTTAETAGRFNTESFTLANSPLIDRTAGSISTTRTRRMPGTSASTRVVTPLPKPITSADVASGRAAAGARGGAGGDAPGPPRREHAEPQGAVLSRAFRHAAGRERREHEGGHAVDHEPQSQRGLGAERDDEHETGEHRSRDAAQRVERVRDADVGAPGRVTGRGEIRKEREAQSHPDRGNQHDRTDCEAHESKAFDRVEAGMLEHPDDEER